jgi:hypothetical protein
LMPLYMLLEEEKVSHWHWLWEEWVTHERKEWVTDTWLTTFKTRNTRKKMISMLISHCCSSCCRADDSNPV